MEYYIFLTLMTAAIAGLAGLLYGRTRHLGFPVGIALLYYWSLYGAWSIVSGQLSGDSAKQYDYLAERVFPIDLDEHYLMALVLYGAFIILVEIILLWLVVQRIPDKERLEAPLIHISHLSIFVLVIASVVGSAAILAEQLTSAVDMNVSAYVATRGGLGAYHPLFTVHQVLNRLAVFSLAIGVAIYVSPKQSVFIEGNGSFLVGMTYAVLLLGTFSYLAILGNKNEAFAGLVMAVVFYAMNTARIRWQVAIPVGLIGLLSLGAVNFLRSLPVLALLDSSTWWEALVEAPEIRSSGESYAAHFSLYGVLYNHVPLTYGSSFVALAASAIPRFLSGERSLGTYVDYAEALSIYEGPTGEAYTVHHATAWYLNFGLAGLFCGAVVLGSIWAWCYNANMTANKADRRWQNLLAIIAPAGMVSAIPLLVRAGPDAYKGLVIEAFILPTLILWWAAACGVWRLRKR
jgi:hypothetical protein